MKKTLRTGLILAALATAAGLGGVVSQTILNNAAFARTEREVESARQQLSETGDLSNVFKTVNHALEPSVVSISTKQVVPGTAMNPFRFFRGPGIPQMPDSPDDGGDDDGSGGGGGIAQGTGSGVIMEVDGSDAYVLTNNHVVDKANELEVTLSDGRIIKDVKVVGVDPRTDLAVVKVHGDKFISAKWGDSSKLEKGDWVMAFGSPLGYVGSMTHGIISALDRQVGILGPAGFEQFIQTDAAINPGNSGGPLVSTKGEVIGINAAIASRSGGFQGIGFAIPSNIAKPVFESLKSSGHVTRGFLGIGIADITAGDEQMQDQIKATGYTGKTGVFVNQVSADAPAQGKLMPGDVITALNSKPVTTLRDFRETVAAAKPGTDMTFTVFRDGKNQDVSLKLGEQPDTVKMADTIRAMPGTDKVMQGLTLQDLTRRTARLHGVEGVASGALVTQVAPGSAAAKAGLRPGDVITRINGTAVTTASEAEAALGSAKGDKPVKLTVSNKEGSRFVLMTVK